MKCTNNPMTVTYSTVVSSDALFPHASTTIDKDKPKFYAYRGDLSLLFDITNNVAVVGLLSPTNEIIERERGIIRALAERGKNIVSGLALGCDTVAHQCAIEFGAKTIAFLPSTLDNIYPKANQDLAERIVQCGGLVVSEYEAAPKSRGEMISRFIKRDRLQAMYASVAVLIASFSKGKGDSGSRHCMQKARAYSRQRYVMFNATTDTECEMFGLNNDLISEGVLPLTPLIISKL